MKRSTIFNYYIICGQHQIFDPTSCEQKINHISNQVYTKLGSQSFILLCYHFSQTFSIYQFFCQKQSQPINYLLLLLTLIIRVRIIITLILWGYLPFNSLDHKFPHALRDAQSRYINSRTLPEPRYDISIYMGLVVSNHFFIFGFYPFSKESFHCLFFVRPQRQMFSRGEYVLLLWKFSSQVNVYLPVHRYIIQDSTFFKQVQEEKFPVQILMSCKLYLFTQIGSDFVNIEVVILFSIYIFQTMSVETCPDCKAKDKKYQILQADLDFQLKKMRQDLAQEKVLLQQQYQKQIKRALQKYNKQKREREEQNKKWIDKYDKKVQQYDQLIDNLTQKYQQTIHNTKEQLTKTFNRKQCQIVEQHQHELFALKKEQEHALHTAQQHQNRQVASVKKHEEFTIGQLENNHRETMEQINNEHESRMKKLKTEMEQINETKNIIQKEASDKQRTLYSQIYERKQEITTLKYQISHLDGNLKNCQEQIRLKGIEIQILKQKFQQDLENANQKFNQQKEQLITGFNVEIQKLLVNKLEDYNKFQQSVKDIQAKRQNQVKIYEHCLQEVKEKVSERPSREEDLEQINFLKNLLIEKERQFQNLINVAKGYKLQLDYKQETFNRIFPSNQNNTNLHPLNIERMLGSRKESKSSKGVPTHLQTTTKFNSIKSLASQQEVKKEKERNISKTTKMF